jgi:hypothetical protein
MPRAVAFLALFVSGAATGAVINRYTPWKYRALANWSYTILMLVLLIYLVARWLP